MTAGTGAGTLDLTADKIINWTEPSAPAGITTDKVYLGPDPFGLGGFQVAVANAATTPTRSALRELFTARKGKTQTQLVLAVVHAGTVQLFGPDPQSQPIELPVEQAQRQLQSVLAEPDILAATERLAGFRKASGTTGVSGFTNSGLFATHHIMRNVPSRADWDEMGARALPLLSLRRNKLIEALGFTTKPGPNGSLLLSVGAHPPRAVAVLLDDSEQFDAKTQRFQLSPVAFGLALAAKQELPWLVVLRKDQIRLYPGRDGVGVGSKGQSETFFEVDLSTVDKDYAALLPLIFSGDALSRDGTADELLRESSRYASELGARLRERIYDEIVPPLAVEVAWRLANDADVELDPAGLSRAYSVTIRILFRLLFQAYAEDRGLLPSGRNEGFDANSLKTIARRLLTADGDDFGDASTIWFDLIQVWNAIDQGNRQWQIPAYDGGLFATDPKRSPEGALIKRIELPDSVLGPALKSLLIDVSEDGVLGPVDFRSLSVREFGTIYEGLLESSLSVADENLTLDSNGAWIPAGKGDAVEAAAGSIYFHTASGERKATGSYFTQKFVVDHLIERSIVPVLTEHLDKVAGHLTKGDAAAAARDFFDFRVADLAMGSGHFLVAAVDKIEALMRDFLTEHSVPGVAEELLRLSEIAKTALGSDDVAKSEVDEVGLLRRQVARRCIYGIDLNPMAVELARLALWIHTFVPGLPMSNLDHGLVNANSLTGIGTTDEALDALQPGRKPGELFFADAILEDQLAAAKTLLVDLANASEANKSEVEQAARLLAEARGAAATARRIFDAAVAARTGRINPGLIVDDDSLKRILHEPAVEQIADELKPAHMPYLFPEVFLRERPGWDVLIGNPPWEKLKVEEQQWFWLRFPGLRALPVARRTGRIAELRRDRPDLADEYQREVDASESARQILISGPYPGIGSGHLDLYKAFAWRNWQLLREGGRFAIVLPRASLTGSGTEQWRRRILAEGTFSDVCVVTNSGNWVFKGVDGRYTVAFVAGLRSQHADRLAISGPFDNYEAFMKGRDNVAEISHTEFLSWTTGATFPLLRDSESAAVFRRMRAAPAFEHSGLRPVIELRPVEDRSRIGTDVANPIGPVPVITGASFYLWDPDFGPPYGYAATSIFDHLLAKTKRSSTMARSPFHGLKFQTVADLPCSSARIAFRDVTKYDNSRGVVAALLPPDVVVMHASPYLLKVAADERDEAFVLGVMSSIPFDWYARRIVELHLTFELLGSMPIPKPDADSAWRTRVVEISGRLAAVDARYSDWAAAVGVPVGSVNGEKERDELLAELDALVGLLYGLTQKDLEYVFSTFHRGWHYENRLARVIEHYSNWKGAAG